MSYRRAAWPMAALYADPWLVDLMLVLALEPGLVPVTLLPTCSTARAALAHYAESSLIC